MKLESVIEFAGKWRGNDGRDYYVVQRKGRSHRSNLNLPELEAIYASGEEVDIPGLGKFLPRGPGIAPGRIASEAERFPGLCDREIFLELIREFEEFVEAP